MRRGNLMSINPLRDCFALLAMTNERYWDFLRTHQRRYPKKIDTQPLFPRPGFQKTSDKGPSPGCLPVENTFTLEYGAFLTQPMDYLRPGGIKRENEIQPGHFSICRRTKGWTGLGEPALRDQPYPFHGFQKGSCIFDGVPRHHFYDGSA